MSGRIFRLLALTAALTFAASSTALAQATATGGNVSFNAQICPQVINQAAAADQYNSGDALIGAIAQNLDISQNAVNQCLQNGGSGSGAGGATASAGGEGGATATGGNVDINLQICTQVIEQYADANQSNSGGGIAAGIAQDLGISQDAVNECIQGDAGGTTTPPDTTDDPPPTTSDDTPDGDTTDDGTTDEEGDLTSLESEVLSDTVPDKVLAATGGPSILLPLSALMVAAGISGFAIIRRR